MKAKRHELGPHSEEGGVMHPLEPRGIWRYHRKLAGSTFWGLILAMMLSASSVHAQTSAVEPLAELDGEVITAEQLEKAIAAPLAKLQEQIYNLKRQRLEAMIAERLFAKESPGSSPGSGVIFAILRCRPRPVRPMSDPRFLLKVCVPAFATHGSWWTAAKKVTSTF